MADPAEDNSGVPSDRLDALTDGVFAFAMTLLVLNLELPDDFAPKGPGDVLAVFHNLIEPLIAYVISFVVLAVCWLGRAQTRNEPERAGGGYAWLVLLHLFFITVVPFSTMVVGEHGDLWPAVWLYSGNMILVAAAAIGMSYLAERSTHIHPTETGRIELSLLIVSAALAAVISLFAASGASWAYCLNFASPLVKRWVRKGGTTG